MNHFNLGCWFIGYRFEMALNRILFVTCLICFQIKPSKQQFRSLILERQTMQNYCSSLKNCNDCKNGALQCEWCHDVGCTNFPRLHCPKKMYLDSILKIGNERFCTEIVTKSPLFVPANVKRTINLNLKIDDMTLFDRNIVCEIRIGQNVIQVKGQLERNTVTCDAVTLKIPRSVELGSLRLIWGGVEPKSNEILLIVYKCQQLSYSCMGCQSLSKEFQCGWCKDTSTCNLVEECPQHYGAWIDKNISCERYESMAFTRFHSQHRHGLWH